eukprot:2417984-Amphidinium_carterae.1
MRTVVANAVRIAGTSKQILSSPAGFSWLVRLAVVASKPAMPCLQRLTDPLVSRRGFGTQKPCLRGFSTEVQKKTF